MFNNFGRKPTQVPPQRQQREQGEGCKMRVRRDQHGRVVGYSDNGKCSPASIKSFADKLGLDKESVEEED